MENILAGAVSSDFEEKLSQNDDKKKERVYSIVNQGAYAKQNQKELIKRGESIGAIAVCYPPINYSYNFLTY